MPLTFITSAPSASIALPLASLTNSLIKILHFKPNLFAPQATDLPWFPAVAVATTISLFPLVTFSTAYAPPRALKDFKLNLSFSSL